MALAGFNCLLDPIGAHPTVSLSAARPYRQPVTSRIAKAELIAHGDCEVLLAGSSRVQVGLPVDASLYNGALAYNMGLDGTTLTETKAVLEFAILHNSIKRVILGVDFLLFSDVREGTSRYKDSKFNPQLNLFEYFLQNAIGSDATVQSWSIMRRMLEREASPLAERGFAPKFVPNGLSQRDLFALRIRQFINDPETFGRFRYSQQQLAIFRDIVRRCRSRGIKLTVFIPPVHALHLEMIRSLGLWRNFESWKSDLTRILAQEAMSEPIPLWDFTGYEGRVAEDVPRAGDHTTRMKWYYESSHFTPALGKLVLRSIHEGQGRKPEQETFGVVLNCDNLSRDLDRTRAAREVYVAGHTADVAWLKQIIKSERAIKQ